MKLLGWLLLLYNLNKYEIEARDGILIHLICFKYVNDNFLKINSLGSVIMHPTHMNTI